jgi:hypothetical protein
MKGLKFWKPLNFDVTSFRWKLKERVGRRFQGSGSDNSSKNTYTYNELGFRGNSFLKNGFKIMSVGCSHTEGIGVNDDETWPHILSNLVPNGVDLNFGYSGRSNDYISRTILTFVEKVNPNLVIVMYTYPSRREYYTNEGGIEPFAINPWGYYKEHPNGIKEFEMLKNLSNEEDDYINWYKNHLLITYYLKSKNIPFVWDGTFIGTDYIDENRFDGDYKKYSDLHEHANKSENETYAKKLYKHLEKIGIIKN